jgi:hypothetical protein
MSEANLPPGGEQPTRAIRLLFSFAGNHVQLVSQQPVEMVLPPSDPVSPAAALRGFWYDLRDARDRSLYRRVIHNPLREDVEAFADNPHPGPGRHPGPHRRGVFVAVVPDIEQGQTVTLCSSPRGVGRVTQQPATEIARFALKKQ